MRQHLPPASQSISVRMVLLCLLLYALGTYTYATLRFVGNWSDSDTAMLTRSIISADENSSILHSDSPYSNGITYQAIILFITQVSGVSVQVLQAHIFPLLAAGLTILTFVTYRALTRSNRVALLATMLLFMQPDFMFVTWRGSHEKVTWAFVLMLLFLLAKSFQQRYLIQEVLLYYLVMFALICSNAFFASSLVATIAVSSLGGSLLLILRGMIHPENRTDAQLRFHVHRLFYVTIASGILLYLFFFYIYPPSLHLLDALGSLIDRVKLLLLNTGSQTVDPYSYISLSWIDPHLYVAMMLLSVGIGVVSALVWLVGIFHFLRRPSLVINHLPQLFLWLIYPTLALQFVLALLADQAGGITNLQVRMLTPLMLAAIPLVALGGVRLLRYIERQHIRWLLIGIAILAVIPFSALTLVKLTNEPILSNNWTFTTGPERTGSLWFLDHSVQASIWTGLDWRITLSMIFARPDIDPTRMGFGQIPSSHVRYLIFSQFEREKWRRRSLPMPYFQEDNRIYDNGTVQLFAKKLPLTFPE